MRGSSERRCHKDGKEPEKGLGRKKKRGRESGPIRGESIQKRLKEQKARRANADKDAGVEGKRTAAGEER